jgi:hypothetical protein
MSEQIEKIDITFKDLEAHDVRILANAHRMLEFIRNRQEASEDCDGEEEFIKAAKSYYIYDLLD